jgi:hypothetical protein
MALFSDNSTRPFSCLKTGSRFPLLFLCFHHQVQILGVSPLLFSGSHAQLCHVFGVSRLALPSLAFLSGYYHPKFLRTSRMFVRNIVRIKVKNDGPRKAAAPEEEPDLYSMPKLPEPISVLPEEKAVPCPSPRFTYQFDAPLQIPFGGIHPLSGVEANVPSAGLSSESEICRNRILARHLVQQQLSQMEALMNAGRHPLQTPSSGSVLSSRRWLNGASSPVTIPEVVPSNTRPSLASLAGLPHQERLLLAALRNSSSISTTKTIVDLVLTQQAPLSLRSLNNEELFSMGLR